MGKCACRRSSIAAARPADLLQKRPRFAVSPLLCTLQPDNAALDGIGLARLALDQQAAEQEFGLHIAGLGGRFVIGGGLIGIRCIEGAGLLAETRRIIHPADGLGRARIPQALGVAIDHQSEIRMAGIGIGLGLQRGGRRGGIAGQVAPDLIFAIDPGRGGGDCGCLGGGRRHRRWRAEGRPMLEEGETGEGRKEDGKPGEEPGPDRSPRRRQRRGDRCFGHQWRRRRGSRLRWIFHWRRFGRGRWRRLAGPRLDIEHDLRPGDARAPRLACLAGKAKPDLHRRHIAEIPGLGGADGDDERIALQARVGEGQPIDVLLPAELGEERVALAPAPEIELDRLGLYQAKALDAQPAPAVAVAPVLACRDSQHASQAGAASLESSRARSMIRPSAAFCSGLMSRPWAWPILSRAAWTKAAIQSRAKSAAMGRALSPRTGKISKPSGGLKARRMAARGAGGTGGRFSGGQSPNPRKLTTSLIRLAAMQAAWAAAISQLAETVVSPPTPRAIASATPRRWTVPMSCSTRYSAASRSNRRRRASLSSAAN